MAHETEDQSDFDSCPQSSSHIRVYSESTLLNDFSNIRSILIKNGYPGLVINTAIIIKKNQFCRPSQLGSKKCLVYLHLPWLGNISMRYEMQIKTVVKRCYFAVEPRIVPSDNFCLQLKNLYGFPVLHQSNIVYQFLCHCNIGTWVVLPKGCNRESSSTYLKPFFKGTLFKTEAHWPALASQLEVFQLKLFSFYRAISVAKSVMCT